MLREILNNSLAYRICQSTLAPGCGFLLRKHFKAIFPTSKGFVLDVGCGPLLRTPMPQGIVFGIDTSLEYIKTYIKDENRRGLVASGGALPFLNNTFDESRCYGVLHHMPDELAASTIQEMIRCTRSGSPVIIIDNTWPRRALLRPLAWLIRKFDRGRWIRRENELISLAQNACPGDWRINRFTYSFFGHEGLALSIRKG